MSNVKKIIILGHEYLLGQGPAGNNSIPNNYVRISGKTSAEDSDNKFWAWCNNNDKNYFKDSKTFCRFVLKLVVNPNIRANIKDKLAGTANDRSDPDLIARLIYDNIPDNNTIDSDFIQNIDKDYTSAINDSIDYSINCFQEQITVNTNEEGVNDNINNSTDIQQKIIDALNANVKQIVLTGAPGTGKTWAVKEYAKKHAVDSQFVQFHSSYDYTDFVEGIRPVTINDSTKFIKLDGIFKAFCRKIVNDQIIKYVEGKNNNNQIEYVQEYTDIKLDEYDEEELFKALKEIYIDDSVDLNPENRDDSPKENYIFIIDEINRANLSKVFGELMYCLEESYRGFDERIQTQYSNLDTFYKDKNGNYKQMKFDCFKYGFFIPKNLIIIGTMNDIDRSVESFDFALRRRFLWIDIKANAVMEEQLKSMFNGKLADEMIDKLIKLAKDINNAIYSSNNVEIGSNLDESYHLGGSYYKDFDGTNIEVIYKNKIKPIINEYYRGRKKDLAIKTINAIEKLINEFENN